MMSQNSQVNGHPPRELHADEEVMLEIQEVEAWDRARGDVGLKFRGREPAPALARPPGLDELADHALGLAHHEEVCLLVDARTGGDCRSADADRQLARPAQLDDLQRVELLRDHAASHDEVGPVEIGLRQVLGVAVDEPELPIRGQQGGERDEPERRSRASRPPDLADGPKTPEGVVAEAGKDQKNAGGTGRRWFQAHRHLSDYPAPNVGRDGPTDKSAGPKRARSAAEALSSAPRRRVASP